MGERIYATDLLSLTYFKTERLLEMKWNNRATSEEFRSAFKQALDFSRKNKVSGFLSDIRQEGIVKLEDLQWLENHIIPNVALTGISKIAVVYEDSTFSTIYAETVKKKSEVLPIRFEIFLDYSSARNWIMAE